MTAVFLGAGTVVVGLYLFAGQAFTQNIESPLPRVPLAPAGNPTTPGKVALGRLLFWDPELSGSRDVACATCHHPDFGYADNRDLSIGVTGVGLGAGRRFAEGTTIPFVKRNSPTVLNTAFNGIAEDGQYAPSLAPMFWDMRARSLETQALEPLKSLEEMRGTSYPEDQAVGVVVARLAAIEEYRTLFAAAFGTAPAVTAENLGKALAAFQRSLSATNAPFDRHMRGERGAMSEAAVRGMERFQQIGCANCHKGPMFSDYKMHVLGVPDNGLLAVSDGGAEGAYAFRTASLRNLRYTAPYMHSGVLEDLQDVLRFYNRVQRGGDNRGGGRNRGGARNANVSREQLDPLLRQLRGVGRGNGDLLAFLDALNDDGFDRTLPARVPSGLPVGGNIR